MILIGRSGYLPCACAAAGSTSAPTSRLRAGGSLERGLAEHLDKALDVLLVIVDVRADAQPPQSRSGVHVLGRQLLRQVGRHAVGETDAQDMRRPQLSVE